MIKYKLTNRDMQTYNSFQWEIGIPQTASGGGKLCTGSYLHYYHSAELAIVLNPLYSDIINPRLWEVEAGGEHKDDLGLKGGCTEMTILREIPLPEITLEQRIRFGILCVKKVYHDQNWNTWSNDWLSNEDRSSKSAARAHAGVYSSPAMYRGPVSDAFKIAANAACASAWSTYCYRENADIYVAYAVTLAVDSVGGFDLQDIIIEAMKM